MEPLNEAALIAPCGMNCRVCTAYLRERNKCPGCRGPDRGKPVTRVRCGIKRCASLPEGGASFCSRCAGFPCEALERLDRRYRARYRMSVIENLERIENSGLRDFVSGERTRWACPACGGTVCVHKGRCSACGKKRGRGPRGSREAVR